MDRLRQLIANINRQLGVLTFSQRVAIGLCAALVAVSLLWLMQWSTTPQLISLVDHDFTLDEQAQAEEALKGHTFEIRGNRIYVKPGERPNMIRLLHSAGALPEGSLWTMTDLVADSNPFMASQERQYRHTFAMGNSIAEIIRTYPFVKRADVMINNKTKRRLGGESDVPTASVSVELMPGKQMSMQIVDGFAKLVAGTVQGLKPHNVYVTDSRTGRTLSPPHPDEAMGLGYMDEVKKREAHLQGKIMSILSYIPGVKAEVSVRLDGSKRSTRSYEHEKPAIRRSKTLEEETTSANRPTEAGTQPNVGMGLTSGTTGGMSTVAENEDEFHEPQLKKEERVVSMNYATQGVMATVKIPRSFIVGVYTAQFPDQENPTDDDLSDIQSIQIAEVKQSVEKIVQAESDSDVDVGIYPDMQWSSAGGAFSMTPMGIAMGAEGASGLDTYQIVRSYGPQVGLGLLAMMSMFMMMRIVRKSADAIPKMPEEEEEVEEEDFGKILSVGPHPVGEAEVGDGFLTGKEVDEETLAQAQLTDEVSRMVEEDPQSAADLLRRWIEESD